MSSHLPLDGLDELAFELVDVAQTQIDLAELSAVILVYSELFRYAACRLASTSKVRALTNWPKWISSFATASQPSYWR